MTGEIKNTTTELDTLDDFGENIDTKTEDEIEILAKYNASLRNIKRPGTKLGLGVSEKWARERMQALAPAAVAELERQLRFGSDGKRMEAAKEILDRAGHGKNDNAVSNKGPSAPVVILVGASIQAPPWASGGDKPSVVDGEVVEKKTEKTTEKKTKK